MTDNGKGRALFLLGSMGLILTVIVLVVVHKVLTKEGAAGFGEVALLVLVGLAAFLGIMCMLSVVASYLAISDGKQPFGLPEGTVRAILTIAFVVLIGVLASFLNTAHQGRTPFVPAAQGHIMASKLDAGAANKMATEIRTQLGGDGIAIIAPTKGSPENFDVLVLGRVDNRLVDDIAKQTLTIPSTIVAAMIGFYFGARGGTESDPEASKRAEAKANLMALIATAPSKNVVDSAVGKAEAKLAALAAAVPPDQVKNDAVTAEIKKLKAAGVDLDTARTLMEDPNAASRELVTQQSKVTAAAKTFDEANAAVEKI